MKLPLQLFAKQPSLGAAAINSTNPLNEESLHSCGITKISHGKAYLSATASSIMVRGNRS